MIKLLSRIFIKNYTDYQNEKVRSQYGILCGAFGIFLNAVLFTLKFVFGTLAASVAMVADAFNNLSDAASSVVLAAAPGTGFGFSNISSVVFTVTSEEPPVGPTPSTPTGPSFTWSERQINLVDLSCSNDSKEAENSLINNIFTSLEQTEDKYENYNDHENLEYCEFSHGQIKISNKCGTLKFKSITGDLTGIVITGNIGTATNLSANWTYDNAANTLTWLGTPAEEVTLSGNLNISVSSIISPAPITTIRSPGRAVCFR